MAFLEFLMKKSVKWRISDFFKPVGCHLSKKAI
jgi:hypothetical protein